MPHLQFLSTSGSHCPCLDFAVSFILQTVPRPGFGCALRCTSPQGHWKLDGGTDGAFWVPLVVPVASPLAVPLALLHVSFFFVSLGTTPHPASSIGPGLVDQMAVAILFWKFVRHDVLLGFSIHCTVAMCCVLSFSWMYRRGVEQFLLQFPPPSFLF